MKWVQWNSLSIFADVVYHTFSGYLQCASALVGIIGSDRHSRWVSIYLSNILIYRWRIKQFCFTCSELWLLWILRSPVPWGAILLGTNVMKLSIHGDGSVECAVWQQEWTEIPVDCGAGWRYPEVGIRNSGSNDESPLSLSPQEFGSFLGLPQWGLHKSIFGGEFFSKVCAASHEVGTMRPACCMWSEAYGWSWGSGA